MWIIRDGYWFWRPVSLDIKNFAYSLLLAAYHHELLNLKHPQCVGMSTDRQFRVHSSSRRPDLFGNGHYRGHSEYWARSISGEWSYLPSTPSHFKGYKDERSLRKYAPSIRLTKWTGLCANHFLAKQAFISWPFSLMAKKHTVCLRLHFDRFECESPHQL